MLLSIVLGKENVSNLLSFIMNYCLCHRYEIAWIAKYDLLGYFRYQRLHWAKLAFETATCSTCTKIHRAFKIIKKKTNKFYWVSLWLRFYPLFLLWELISLKQEPDSTTKITSFYVGLVGPQISTVLIINLTRQV